MKKSVLTLTTLVCGSLLVGGALPVLAADNDAKTKGTVTFEAGEDEDTGKPVDPGGNGGGDGGTTEPGGGNSKGALRIQDVTNFDFGTQKIAATDKTYNAKVVKFTPEDTSEAPYYMANYLQVADLSGLHEGWKVKVSTTDFVLDGKTDVLKGAEIRLSEFQEGMATGDGVSTNLPSNDTGKGYKAITKTPDTIYSANATKGAGLHTLVFGNKNIAGADEKTTHTGVQLFVPATSQAKVGSYTADLTWTITAAPL